MANLSNINNKFLVTTGGDVGVGITSPVEKLDTLNIAIGGATITSYSPNKLRIDNNGGNSRFYSTGANTTTTGSYQIHVTSSDGSINNPALTIASNTNATFGGNVTVADDIITTGGSKSVKYFRRWYMDANNDFGINNNAGTSTLFYMNSSGNVGIGTTSPGTLHGVTYGDTMLHVDGGTSRGQMILEGNQLAGVIMSDNGATANERVFTTMVDGGNYKIKPVNDNGTSTAAGAAITVLHGGNVGIGTTSPDTTLEVKNPTLATDTVNTLLTQRWSRSQTGAVKWGNSMDLLLGSYESGTINSRTRVDFKLANGATDDPDTTVMTLQANGNVGIGTTSPTTKFQVIDGFFQHSASKIHAASVNLFSVKFSAGTSTCKGAITVTITGSRYSPGNNDYAGGAVYHLVRNNVANLVTYTQYTFGTWQPVIDTNNTTKTWTFSSAYFGIPNNNTVYSVTIQGAGHQVTTVTNPVVTIL